MSASLLTVGENSLLETGVPLPIIVVFILGLMLVTEMFREMVVLASLPGVVVEVMTLLLRKIVEEF
jgi:uncharacterized YccA/Bax inhibitor family protein